MPESHIHLITKPVDSSTPNPLTEMVKLGEQTKPEPAADDDNVFTLCCPAKRITGSSARYWNGVKQYRNRMRIVPVKRVFSPVA
jgi:hypothetical protein